MAYFALAVYQGVSNSDWYRAAHDTAEEMGGELSKGGTSESRLGDIRIIQDCGSVSAYVDTTWVQDKIFRRKVAQKLNAIWIELFFCDQTYWGFSLYQSRQHVNTFSTTNEKEHPGPSKTPDSIETVKEALCALWGCESSRIDEYLVRWKFRLPWYSYALWWIKWVYRPPQLLRGDHWYIRLFEIARVRPDGFAYPADKSKYGDYYQGYDFLRALDASNPLEESENVESYSISLPKLSMEEEIQALKRFLDG